MDIVVDKKDIVTLEKLKIISQLDPINEKIKQFKNRYGCSLKNFEKKLSRRRSHSNNGTISSNGKRTLLPKKELKRRLRETDYTKNIRIA